MQSSVRGERNYFFVKLNISFEISPRGIPHRTVSVVASGQEAPFRCTFEKTAVVACLQQLQEHGYIVPDLSYFRIKALEEGSQDVAVTTERLCELNEDNMVRNMPILL